MSWEVLQEHVRDQHSECWTWLYAWKDWALWWSRALQYQSKGKSLQPRCLCKEFCSRFEAEIEEGSGYSCKLECTDSSNMRLAGMMEMEMYKSPCLPCSIVIRRQSFQCVPVVPFSYTNLEAVSCLALPTVRDFPKALSYRASEPLHKMLNALF